MSAFKVSAVVLLLATQISAFRPISSITRRSQCSSLQMSEFASQVLAAQPTIEEWLDVAEPGLKKAVLAMFRSVKEVSYKMRTASFGMTKQHRSFFLLPIKKI
jgi:hypothetical protein